MACRKVFGTRRLPDMSAVIVTVVALHAESVTPIRSSCSAKSEKCTSIGLTLHANANDGYVGTPG